MASFPTYAKILFEGYQETPEPGVIRTPTEGGMIKQRKRFSRVLVQRPAKCIFLSLADYESFLTWHESTINRVDWFDFVEPRTGATIQARIAGGKIESSPMVALKQWGIRLTLESWGY